MVRALWILGSIVATTIVCYLWLWHVQYYSNGTSDMPLK